MCWVYAAATGWAFSSAATAGWVAAAASAAGAAAQAKTAQQQAAIAESNKQSAAVAAKDAIVLGKTEEANLRSEVAAFKSRQTAEMSASGVELSPGSSAIATLEKTTTLGELDALQIRRNAKLQQQALKHQAAIFGSQANLRAGTSGAFATLIGGGVEGYRTYSALK